ncbi:MAG: twin-arginine translocase subunit TatC [Cocleimonas sp.]
MIDPDSFETEDTPKKSSSKTDAGSAVVTGFLSHLIELRDRLLRVVIVIAVTFVVLFPFAKDIYNILAIPLGNLTTIAITPIAPFLVPMKLTLLVAFLVALPYSLYQLWSFVAPGLYKHEKRLVYPLLASSVFLFYLGIAFVYFILLPMMFTILPSFAPAGTVVQPDIGFYLDFVIMMSMAFGFGFEMPIATILLISTGMTTAEKLKKKRPYVIVGAFVVGMLLTPPDVVSQIMLAIPMWILFELGIYLSKFFKVRIKEASEAKQARDTASSSAVALSADKLWEDDDYTYEEEDDDDYSDGLSDEERSILNKDPLTDDKNDDEYLPEEEKDFFDSVDYDEPSDDEMEEELDRIEAQEKTDKIVKKKAKKRAKKKTKAKKKKTKNKKDDKPTPDEPEEGP